MAGPRSTAPGKIALEEHFVPGDMPELISGVGWAPNEWDRVVERLKDTDRRVAEMDRLGIDKQVVSLCSVGVQGVQTAADAVGYARRANEALADIVRESGGRLLGFAAVALQSPGAAADELERCVTEYGFKGALVNGYSDLGDEPLYYDNTLVFPFWERVEALGVPVYLHPRNPPEDQRRIYAGRPELLGPTWAFAVETGTHALRLITSGLFDRFPALAVILGHLGEFLPFALARLDQRIAHIPELQLERPARDYLAENFYITTSGNYHTPSLLGVLLEVGVSRVLFATDYPFEEMEDGVRWFDEVPISAADRIKIGSENARRLLRIDD